MSERSREGVTVVPGVVIPVGELVVSACRSRGPGGQHVNTSETAVQVSLDLRHSPALPEDIRQRLLQRLASRLTREGVLQVRSEASRSRERNRQEALHRLERILQAAAKVRPRRKATKPSKAAIARRLTDKARRSQTKRQRRPPQED